jgi:hypothetical protein
LVALNQCAEPPLPWVTVNSCSFDRLLGIDPLTICLAWEDWEWTELRGCGIGEQELGKFLLLTIEKATDAVNYIMPVGMDVYRIRLALTR